MFGKSLKVLAAAAALGLASQAGALQIFLSPTNVGPQTVISPGVSGQPGANTALPGLLPSTAGLKAYIWVLPSADDGTLNGLSLNVRVKNLNQIAVTGAVVYNPANGANTRWQTFNGGTASPAARGAGSTGVPADSFIGVYKTTATFVSSGVGISTSQTNDAGRDPVSGAFLYGEIDYDTLATFNPLVGADLFLQVGGADSAGPGANDISGGKVTNTLGTFIGPFFGTGDSAVDNVSATMKGSESTIADGHVGTVPEPMSLGLLGIGALALVRRRTA